MRQRQRAGTSGWDEGLGPSGGPSSRRALRCLERSQHKVKSPPAAVCKRARAHTQPPLPSYQLDIPSPQRIRPLAHRPTNLVCFPILLKQLAVGGGGAGGAAARRGAGVLAKGRSQ